MAGRSLTAKIRVGSVGIAALLALALAPAVHAALVVNEVDYDTPGATEDHEFVEIYNNSTTTQSLANRAVVFVGSDSVEYSRVPLPLLGSLAAGAYFVVGDSSIVAGLPADTFATFPAADNIQNGSPGGVALIDTAPTPDIRIDSLSYEGDIIAATLDNNPTGTTYDLRDGAPPLPASQADNDTIVDSLTRSPNGQDNNAPYSDWQLASQGVFPDGAPGTITPGAANPDLNPTILPIVGLPPTPGGEVLVATTPRKKCPKHKRLKRGRCVKKKKKK